MEEFIESNQDLVDNKKHSRMGPLKGSKPRKDTNYVQDMCADEGFICKVLVYLPFSTASDIKATADQVRVNIELSVVHTTTLMELADSINCATDNFAMREVNNLDINLEEFQNNKVLNNPKPQPLQISLFQKRYPSRCFFIENTFYNDMSHPDSIDYSEVVRKWASENKIGNFHSKSMEGVGHSNKQILH